MIDINQSFIDYLKTKFQTVKINSEDIVRYDDAVGYYIQRVNYKPETFGRYEAEQQNVLIAVLRGDEEQVYTAMQGKLQDIFSGLKTYYDDFTVLKVEFFYAQNKKTLFAEVQFTNRYKL